MDASTSANPAAEECRASSDRNRVTSGGRTGKTGSIRGNSEKRASIRAVAAAASAEGSSVGGEAALSPVLIGGGRRTATVDPVLLARAALFSKSASNNLIRRDTVSSCLGSASSETRLSRRSIDGSSGRDWS